MENIEDEIRRLTPTIWDTILRLPLEVDEGQPMSGKRLVSACVHITGAWNGTVALNCEADFARQAAEIMFALAPEPATTSDMHDALGELANVIGGNIKALLPESCHLSLPAMVEGTDDSLGLPGIRLVTRVFFRSGHHALSVSLLEREERDCDVAKVA